MGTKIVQYSTSPFRKQQNSTTLAYVRLRDSSSTTIKPLTSCPRACIPSDPPNPTVRSCQSHCTPPGANKSRHAEQHHSSSMAWHVPTHHSIPAGYAGGGGWWLFTKQTQARSGVAKMRHVIGCAAQAVMEKARRA